jgi:hypothetical protein
MPSTEILRCVVLVRTDVLEECITSIIRVTRIRAATSRSVLRLLVTANVVPSSPILVGLMMEVIRSSEMSVLTRDTRRNFPEVGNLLNGKELLILYKLSKWLYYWHNLPSPE